ncbi:hypothetical protein EXU48_12750 [Occultella glacieicola]|uniref:Uncharacterized protein n=1 Tax=Occultella glacieicola TaxID=2518684 RepID=A0ABY2E1V7_9MICO|nr:hypothetical protein [Occultella glacieicola]TDE92433.1 hypothetical protein EXU48_12750 [Occultella glacieicola]
MSVLTVAASATVGSLSYASNISSVRVDLALAPGVASALLVLPRDLRVEAEPGEDVEIALRGEGEDEVRVFTGTVQAVRRSLGEVTVICGDAAAALAGIRTGATFEQQSAGAIVRALIREAGARAGTVDLDLDLVTYVAHQGRTALEHVATLAGWAGAIASSNPDGGLDVLRFPSPPADVALRYGREIAELTLTAGQRSADVALAGSGPAGSTSAPGARRQSTGVVPSDAAGPDATTVREAAPALRTPTAVSGATRARNARNGAPRLTGGCWLVPGLRAGTTVEIADAPRPGAAGPWLLTRVQHRVGPGARGLTRFEGIGLAATGGGALGALLGAAGDAFGGLP